MTGEMPDGDRAKHAHLFLCSNIEGGVQILYRGAVLMTIERDDRLPPGLWNRLVTHTMDLLIGRRTALWDEQAIFKDKPFSPGDARRRAAEQAETDAQNREAEIATSSE